MLISELDTLLLKRVSLFYRETNIALNIRIRSCYGATPGVKKSVVLRNSFSKL